MEQRQRTPLGVQANAWSAAATGSNGTSASVDLLGCKFVTAFGASNGATTITLQVSADGSTWYDSQVNQVLSGAGDFCLNATLGARFVRLKSGTDRTVTATIQARD